MARHPKDMNSPRPDLKDKEHVDPAQQHGIDGEEITGQHRLRLRPAELPPRRSATPRRWIQSRPAQDVPHCCWRHAIAQADQLTVDTAVTPRRVLPGKPDHELADHCSDSRATADRLPLRREGPVPNDQLPVLAQLRLWRHDPHPQQFPREQPNQCGEHQPILRLQPRPIHLPAQHRDLVPKHHQLDISGRRITSSGHDQRKHHPQGRVQSREEHRMIRSDPRSRS